jgi:hypothetical protein
MLKELLDNLGSSDYVTREDALRDASALPSRAKLKLFNMAAERYQRQRRHYAWKSGIYLSLFTLWFIGMQFVAESLQAGLFWGMIGGFIANGVLNRSPEQARRQMVLLGQNIQDVRFVLPLLHLLYEADSERPDPVLADVLKRLLPSLRYDDVKHWRPAERALLLLPLENRSDPELTLCMLQALEQVGDERAIPLVAKLAGMRLYDPRISPAAQECLPYLYAHMEQQWQAQTLLRPTDAITDGTDNLLRPADTDTDDKPSDELLRADSTVRDRTPYG